MPALTTLQAPFHPWFTTQEPACSDPPSVGLFFLRAYLET